MPAIDLPKGPHKALIAAAIRMRGATLKDVALRHGANETACRQALRRRYLPGELAIAAFLGLPPQHLWPDRWTSDGQRIDHRFARNGNLRPGPRQRQKWRVA